MAEGVDPQIVLAHTDHAPPIVPEPRREGRERKKRTDAEIWERRMEMARLHASGKYLRAIAEKMGTSISHVSEEINQVVEYYRQQALKSVAEQIAKEDALIHLVQLEAIRAWFESKEGKIVNNKKRAREIRRPLNANNKHKRNELGRNITAKRIRDEIDDAFGIPPGQEEQFDVEKMEMYEREETSPGDPRFLQIILDCSDRRAKLHGLYPKQDFAGGIGGHGPGSDDEIENLSAGERLSRLNNLLEQARLEKARRLALKSAEVGVHLPASIATTRVGQIIEVPQMQVPQPAVSDDSDGEALWNATR